jgi:VIT1/CCC1 family predicted Fe2+/Mn2+ transporter
MESDDRIKKNLNSSLYLILISNLVAAFLFFIAYLFIKNIWFLIASIVIAIISVAFIFVIQYLKNKFLGKHREDSNKGNL